MSGPEHILGGFSGAHRRALRRRQHKWLLVSRALGVVLILTVSLWSPYQAEQRIPIASPYPTYTPLHSDSRRSINLNGEWQFRLDPRQEGSAAEWYSPNQHFADTIRVPGTWQSQSYRQRQEIPDSERKIGSEVGPQTQYLGSAWYKKIVVVPQQWPAQEVWLKLGGVNPAAEVWINGEHAGNATQPGIPARFNITRWVKPGRGNDITIRVYEENRGLGNWYNLIAWWSGLWRTVSIEITRDIWIQDVSIRPDIDRSVAILNVEVAADRPLLARTLLKVGLAFAEQRGPRDEARTEIRVNRLGACPRNG